MARGTMLIGDGILLANLQVKEKEMDHKVAKALQNAGGEIIRVTLPKTPLATGELRKRSFNEGPLLKKGVYTQVVGFEKYGEEWEKEGTSYAVPVHENLESRHRVGENQFLKKGAEETGPKLGRYLQKQVHL